MKYASILILQEDAIFFRLPLCNWVKMFFEDNAQKPTNISKCAYRYLFDDMRTLFLQIYKEQWLGHSSIATPLDLYSHLNRKKNSPVGNIGELDEESTV